MNGVRRKLIATPTVADEAPIVVASTLSLLPNQSALMLDGVEYVNMLPIWKMIVAAVRYSKAYFIYELNNVGINLRKQEITYKYDEKTVTNRKLLILEAI